MDTVVSYSISIGLIAFGAWIVFAAAKASSGPLLVWAIMGVMPVAVGIMSLFSEMRTDTTNIKTPLLSLV
jgi:hypothetical protein